MWPRDEVTEINCKYSRGFLPGLGYGLARGFPSQRLKVFGKVKGFHEAQDVGLKALKIGAMEVFDSRFLDSPVHALGLPIGPG